MGVSIYYTAYRERGLSDAERDLVAEIVTGENQDLYDELNESLPRWKDDGTVPSYITDAREICEGLAIYRPDPHAPAEGVILAGSSKISHSECGPEPLHAQLEYYLQVALGQLRRALPDADWKVHVDDHGLVWEEESEEYVFG